MKTVVRIVSTFLFSGYVPRVPGTAGSVAGLLFALMVSYDKVVYLSSLFVLIILAMIVVKRAEIMFGKKDSGRIVIDEVIGIMIALLFVPLKPAYIVSAFVLFRIFDIFKPFPIRTAERVPGPVGVVLDDAIAGIYANIIVRAAIIVLSK